MLAEIVTNEALRRGSNLIVDGSLRDAEYHATLFQSLRDRYPHYSIAIVSVTADAEAIKLREARRAERTGRL